MAGTSKKGRKSKVKVKTLSTSKKSLDKTAMKKVKGGTRPTESSKINSVKIEF